ncbi:MAG TPA: DUF4079 family protein [Thermodesulfovibrionales bacterium]|nr:DUF4079 family protein [Thermodesulfovibrionales bacterium]
MVDRGLIADLKPVHGVLNLLIMFLFWYQAFLGLTIRKARKAGGMNPRAMKRHRKAGPFFALLAVAGYSGGVLLAYLDGGRLLKYPLHFLNGTIIIAAVSATFVVSRRMTLRNERLRNMHLTLGLLILCLYALQVIIGIGILF